MIRTLISNCRECPFHGVGCDTESNANIKYDIDTSKVIPLECDIAETE